MAIDKRIERKFEKEFVNGLLIRPFKEYPFLVDKIKKAMQDAYDLGHADGVADMFFQNQEQKAMQDAYEFGYADGVADAYKE